MIKFYSRSRSDMHHLYMVTEDGKFYWMDHCWTGYGEWVLRETPIPDLVEITEERAMLISKGTAFSAPKFMF